MYVVALLIQEQLRKSITCHQQFSPSGSPNTATTGLETVPTDRPGSPIHFALGRTRKCMVKVGPESLPYLPFTGDR
eukprot:14237924-Alexandrium_andersonii.AAC.1